MKYLSSSASFFTSHQLGKSLFFHQPESNHSAQPVVDNTALSEAGQNFLADCEWNQASLPELAAVISGKMKLDQVPNFSRDQVGQSLEAYNALSDTDKQALGDFLAWAAQEAWSNEDEFADYLGDESGDFSAESFDGHTVLDEVVVNADGFSAEAADFLNKFHASKSDFQEVLLKAMDEPKTTFKLDSRNQKNVLSALELFHDLSQSDRDLVMSDIESAQAERQKNRETLARKEKALKYYNQLVTRKAAQFDLRDMGARVRSSLSNNRSKLVSPKADSILAVNMMKLKTELDNFSNGKPFDREIFAEAEDKYGVDFSQLPNVVENYETGVTGKHAAVEKARKPLQGLITRYNQQYDQFQNAVSEDYAAMAEKNNWPSIDEVSSLNSKDYSLAGVIGGVNYQFLDQNDLLP